MAHLFLIIVVTLSFLSCNQHERSYTNSTVHVSNRNIPFKNYELRGNIRGLKSDSILLIKFIDSNIDTKFISVIDGKFNFQDSMQAPFFVQLNYFENILTTNTGKQIETSFTGGGKLTEFIIEPGKTYIEGPSPQYDSIIVWGGRSDSILKSYLKEDEVLDRKYSMLKITHARLVKTGKTADANKLAIEMNSINKIERIVLLKTYVKRKRWQYSRRALAEFLYAAAVLDQKRLFRNVQLPNYGNETNFIWAERVSILQMM